MADRAPENTNTKINSSEYPDPRLWLLASAKKEIFQPESIMRLNILGGHDNSDKIGAMRNMRIFEV